MNTGEPLHVVAVFGAVVVFLPLHLRKDDKRLEYNYTDHEGNTVSSITNGGKERYWEFCLKYNKTFWDKFNFSISTAACKSMDEGIIEGDYVQYRNTSWSIRTQNILMMSSERKG